MKGSSWNSTGFNHNTLFILFFLYLISGDVFSISYRPICHPKQRDALIEFKNELEKPKPCYDGFRKMESWMNNSDCCFWDGVTCDANFGHVIEVNISYSCLDGLISSKSNIFRLQSLRLLDLSNNNLRGEILPSLTYFSNLTYLDLSHNNFAGKIPSTIENLLHLSHLGLNDNKFVGEIPSSLGNLFHLISLGLCANNFVGKIPSSLGYLSHLTDLALCENNFAGEIPSSFANLSHLTFVDLSDNQFTGEIPSYFSSLNKLVSLSFEDNKLSGNFPFLPLLNLTGLSDLSILNNQLTGTLSPNMSSLSNLIYFYIDHNAFIGTLPSSLFSIPSLTYFDVSDNQLNGTLEFGNISSSLEFLRIPYKMETFDISNNEIKGQVPGWLWSLPNLEYVDLSNNKFIGFERSMNPILSSTQEPQMTHLFGANNNFRGNIPSFICGFSSLRILDLSNNRFNGSIPSCLGNFSTFLKVLNLSKNRLSGGIPENLSKYLESVDLGHNQLVGKLPRSLVHISSLEVLNVESNKFNDTFPFWLSSLRKLKVLVLRTNAFHGPIQKVGFSELRIIDISGNHFSGTLPLDCFVNCTAMFSLGITERESNGGYIGTYSENGGYYTDSIVLMNKGVEMKLVRILKIFTAIDFSRNKFEGEIPSSIGRLKELYVLNLSNNAFSGHIPSTMANLTELESLDVSQNKLSGEIPQELGKLSFLAHMDFSHNQLVGPIPGGTQFQTQPCSSFEDNPGLFGPTLDRACGDKHKKTSQQSERPEKGEDEEEVISWIAAAIGVIPGISFGFTMGYILLSNKPELFIKTFGRNRR